MFSLLPIILAAVSVGLYFTAISPLYDEIQKTKIQVEELDKALEDSKKVLSLRDSLLERLNVISSEDEERIEKMLPDSPDTVPLALEIESVASRFGLRLETLSLGDAATRRRSAAGSEDEQPFKTATLNFVLKGTYESFRAFLSRLERNIRIVDVAHLSFSPNKDEKTKAESFTVTAVAYFRDAGEDAPAAEGQ